MGAADDFMKSLLEGHPEIQSVKLSEQELNRLLASHQQGVNSNRLKEFDGLSPEQMHRLLYTPFSPGSLLSLKLDVESHLVQVPLFKLSELLLSEIHSAKVLKLTLKGNLPVRVCELLHNQQAIQWHFMQYVKRITEDDIPYIWPLKQYLLDTGIVKKRSNSLSLTKQGEQFVKGPAASRFSSLLKYFSSQFHWGNFYDIDDDGKWGQLGWAYSLLLLSRYGSDPLESEFYSLKWMRAFENGLWQAEQQVSENEAVAYFHRAYAVRFFECFANWFGLVTMERRPSPDHIFLEELYITRTALFDRLFDFTP